MIKFNQNAWLKPCIDMNTDLRKKQKMILKNICLSWWIMQDLEKLWKMWENLEILTTTERRRNYLVSAPNYYATELFTEHLLAIQMKKTEIFKNKPLYLELSILELSKILMCEFWYDYVKLKHHEKANLRYTDTDSFIVYLTKDDIYKEDVIVNVETRLDTLDYELDKPLPKWKNIKEVRLMKYELGAKSMIKFVGLRAKTYTYLIEDGNEDKKAKGTKSVS